MLALLADRQAWDCNICGETLIEVFHACFDHRVSLHDGGPHTWANLRAVHYACNLFKGRRTLEETWALMGRSNAPLHYNLKRARDAERRAAGNGPVPDAAQEAGL